MLMVSTSYHTDRLTSMGSRGRSRQIQLNETIIIHVPLSLLPLPSSLPPSLPLPPSLLIFPRLSLGSSFHQEASGAVLDLDGDESTGLRQTKAVKKWYIQQPSTSPTAQPLPSSHMHIYLFIARVHVGIARERSLLGIAVIRGQRRSELRVEQ